MNQKIMLAAVALVAAGGLYWTQQSEGEAGSQAALPPVAGAAIVGVVLPAAFTPEAQIGKRGFENNCAKCHGDNGAGKQGVAPPLVHVIYEPNHHADEAIQRAVANGVRSHHWRFGNMPAVKGLTRADVSYIITYIRELQIENGIR